MKRVVITGKGRVELVEAPMPEPRQNWVLVKVHVAPMCTEYKGFVNGMPGEFLGHEAAGEVVATAQPCRVQPGDRVVVMPTYPCGNCGLCVSGEYIHCGSGPGFERFTGSREGSATMAEYLLKPDWLLPRIPSYPDSTVSYEEISYELASLALCALGPSFGAFQRMAVSAADTVLITGLGPVGLGAVVNARFRGARVIGVDTNPWRAERARLLGADLVLDPRDEATPPRIREFTAAGEGRRLRGSEGADAALDCSGSPQAHRLLIDATRRRGRIAFVGECNEETVIRISPDLIRKGLTLIGSWHYNLADFAGVMGVIQRVSSRKDSDGRNGGLDATLGGLISHVFPMSRAQEAFETLAGQLTAKVLLKPGE